MSHRSDDERLSAWLDGELSPDERRDFETLLAESPELQAELDALRQISDLVRSIPQSSAPNGLHDSIMQEVHSMAARPAASTETNRRGLRAATRLLTASLVLAVAAGGVMWLNRTDSGSGTAGGPEIVSASRPGMQQASRVQLVGRELQATELDDESIVRLARTIAGSTGRLTAVRFTGTDPQATVLRIRSLLEANEFQSADATSSGSDDVNGFYLEARSPGMQKTLYGILSGGGFRTVNSTRVDLTGIAAELRATFAVSGTELPACRGMIITAGGDLDRALRGSTDSPGSSDSALDDVARVIIVLER